MPGCVADELELLLDDECGPVALAVTGVLALLEVEPVPIASGALVQPATNSMAATASRDARHRLKTS
jgi:hypothetical protein